MDPVKEFQARIRQYTPQTELENDLAGEYRKLSKLAASDPLDRTCGLRFLRIGYLTHQIVSSVDPRNRTDVALETYEALETALEYRPALTATEPQKGVSSTNPKCGECGHSTVKNGAEFRCHNCGTSAGCC